MKVTRYDRHDGSIDLYGDGFSMQISDSTTWPGQAQIVLDIDRMWLTIADTASLDSAVREAKTLWRKLRSEQWHDMSYWKGRLDGLGIIAEQEG